MAQIAPNGGAIWAIDKVDANGRRPPDNISVDWSVFSLFYRIVVRALDLLTQALPSISKREILKNLQTGPNSPGTP